MKRIYWYSFWGIAVLQLFTTWAAMLKSFSMGMSRFESGKTIISGTEQFLTALWKFLAFPIGTLYWKFKCLHLPGVLGWIPLIFNSLLWAGVVMGIIVTVVRFKESQNKNIKN